MKADSNSPGATVQLCIPVADSPPTLDNGNNTPLAGPDSKPTLAHTNFSNVTVTRDEGRQQVDDRPATEVLVRINSKTSSKRFLVIGAIVAVIAAAATTIYFFNKNSQPKSKTLAPAPVVTVTARPATERLVDDTIAVTGSVAAWDPLQVGAEVSGLRITSVEAEEGDTVKKGQVLAKLNAALLNAQLQQARARLVSAEAALKKAIQPNRPEEITAFKAALAHAEATVSQEEAKRAQARVNLANAELNAGRYAELSRMGATSSQEAESKLVSAETAREEITHCDARIRAAQFMVDQAREKLLAAQRGGRTEDVAISRANIEEAKAQIQHLQEQIAQTIIRAPDDGVVTRRDAHLGNITTAGTPLFQMIRQNRHEVRATASDIDLSRFKPGQTVKITTNESEVSPISGTVRLVIPQVDPVTRLGTVRIDLPTDTHLKPGMFVRGTVRLGSRKSVTVPVEAVVASNGETSVFVLSKDNRALSRVIKTGSREQDYIEVKKGLSPGESVIVQGARFLADRDLVKLAP